MPHPTVLSGESEGPLPLSGRGLRLRAEVQSQLGHTEQALALLAEAYDGAVAPQMADLVAKLEAGEAVPPSISSAREGIAEAFYTMAQVLYGQAGNSLSLVYAQAARDLNPENVDALLMVASIFDEQGNYDLASDLYDKVPREHPAFLQAEFGRANALRYADRKDAAIEVLNQLSKSYPDLVEVQVSLGDALTSDERWEAARVAYDKAVELIEEPGQGDWQIFYARGITLERLKEWPEAEADFRRALELSPDEPRVLNYLGYSLVERRENLDEALDMIRLAAEQRPDDGYISDSLGWVYYRLGRYEEAVAPMEHAAEIMAIDPVINDHLGDVYWAVGRKLEAQFMWRRALSFTEYGSSNEEVDPDRIRRKLEVGLDKVLAEEGAEPLGTNSEGN
ncbi:tetratricopeptide repeat protein [Mangrovicoccus ximenensis]|uniref:tetratricopeptide repeat protein n=1 Tax=Mangrovicoccus ximenensis TaxID=1911570 RepID=UPI001374B83B|nr:tetratricopeptide repeat protein [Mangrovicoccus ximenensis]